MRVSARCYIVELEYEFEKLIRSDWSPTLGLRMVLQQVPYHGQKIWSPEVGKPWSLVEVPSLKKSV